MNKQRWDGGGGGGGGGGRGGDGGGGRNSRRNNMNQDRDRSPIGNNNDRGGGNGGYGNSGFGGNMGGGGGGNNNNNNNNNSNNMGSGGGNNNNNMGGGGGNRGGGRNDGFSGRNDGGSGRGDMGGRGGNRGGNDMGSGGGGGGNGNGNGNNGGIGGGGFEMGAMNDIQYNKGNFNTQSRQMPQMMQPQIQPQCIPPPMQQEPTNDCEIIVVARTLTEYAEAIETRLKNLGLMVDLLFPNDDVPIGKVLANISSRGCLYAIVVTPQNEEHQSITVNLLHGQPAEHRNMPVDDAIELIVTNFDEVLRSRRGGGGVSGNTNINSIGNINDRMPTSSSSSSSSAAPPLNKQHPDAIQKLLNILADNRVLTVLQYDVILKYLGERRELQLGVELGDDYVKTNNPMTNIKLNSNNPTMPTTTILSSTVGAMSSSTVAAAESIIDGELEIQKKLMEILNKPSITTNSISNIIDKNKNSIGAAATATAVGAKIPVLGQSSSGLISDHLHHHNQNQQQQQQFNQTGNKSKIGSIGGAGGGGGGIAEKQLLHDPKVQMALDSLLQKNLFKL